MSLFKTLGDALRPEKEPIISFIVKGKVVRKRKKKKSKELSEGQIMNFFDKRMK